MLDHRPGGGELVATAAQFALQRPEPADPLRLGGRGHERLGVPQALLGHIVIPVPERHLGLQQEVKV